MARRIKEEPIVHQNRIAEQAIKLFSEKGIESTKMDDIAKLAGYSKATLYVYFKNKEDIVSFIALQSMTKLKDTMEQALAGRHSVKENFFLLCDSLVHFQKDYPDFFAMSLKYISLNSAEGGEWDDETYKVGEDINRILFDYFDRGIKSGDFRPSDNCLKSIFYVWAMIAGLITLASEKEEYLYQTGRIGKEEFLREGFEKIYSLL